jgi:hypothetical protein
MHSLVATFNLICFIETALAHLRMRIADLPAISLSFGKEQEHIVQFRGNLDSVRFTGNGAIARTQYLNGTWSPPYRMPHQRLVPGLLVSARKLIPPGADQMQTVGSAGQESFTERILASITYI